MRGANRLRRVLGPVSLTSLGVGAIIGTGIFVLTGVAAHDKAGPGLSLSFVLAGIACVFAALCYAELASMIPVAGSAYTYAYATLGELFAWIIGWDLVLEYAVGAITVAIGWSGYFVKLLEGYGITLPHAITHGALDGGIVNVPAVVLVALVTTLLVVGVKESARFTSIVVVIKVIIVLVFLV